MTAKEKALELFERFGVFDFHPENTGNGWVKNIEESKKMALKVTDELIKAFLFQEAEFGDDYPTSCKYWQEVKREIELL